MPRLALLMLTLAGGWLASVTAGAAAEDDEPAPGERPPAVVRRTPPAVVRGELPASLPEDPSAFSTVIQTQDYAGERASVEDLLAESPGVQVRRFGGPGQAAEVSIRGSTASQVVILLDGVRLNGAQSGAVDLSTLPLSLFERIEITRGGGSAQTGSDAIGGVINLVTKRAETATETAVAGSAGSFDTYELSALDRRKLGAWYTVAGYDGFWTEGDFEFRRPRFEVGGSTIIPEPDPLERVNARAESHAGLFRVGRDVGEQVHVALVDHVYYASRGEPGLDSGTGGVGGQREFAHDRFTRNLAILSLEAAALPFGFDAGLRVHHRWEREHFRDPFPALGPEIDSVNENSSLGGRLDFERRDRLGPFASRTSLAIEGANDSLDSNEFADTSRGSVGSFLQEEIGVLEGRLLLVPGLRFDWTEGFDGEWIPRIGLIVAPWSWLRLKTNVERSYRVPNFDELYLPDKGFIRGNPALEPEEAIGFDAGGELAFERVGPLRDLRLEVAYFRNDIDDSIVFVLINPFTIAPLNTGAATAQGVEAALSFGLTGWLRFAANYTFLDATLDATGTPLPGRARNEVTLRGELGPPSRVARLVLESTWTDAIPTSFTGQTRISGRTVFGASLSLNLARIGRLRRWLPVEDLIVSFGANNLLDVSVRDALFFPQPGRSFYGMLEVSR